MRKQILIKGNYAYIYAPEHPHAIMNGYVAFHRLILEDKLGRLLQEDELCHHLDGNSLNNNPNNLIAISKADHMREHKALKVFTEKILYDEYITQRCKIEHIAEKYNCTRQTVMKYMKKFNITQELQQQKLGEQITLLRKQNLSQSFIAKTLGVSQMSVSRRLQELN